LLLFLIFIVCTLELAEARVEKGSPKISGTYFLTS
jgi:hypothetical protein